MTQTTEQLAETTEIQAIMDASGHTEADAKQIVLELRKAGWRLIKPIWGPAMLAAPSREAPEGYSKA
jgi:hypothetical protein